MANTHFFASELERDGQAALKRAGHLLAMAETLRGMPGANAPTAEMRQYLAGLGFCVVHVDALAMAEKVMRVNEPVDDGLGMHGTGPTEWEKALRAVQEALLVTNHPRLA
jgi:hypothetical protein